MMEKITDYKDYTSLLAEQYKDTEKFKPLVSCFLDVCNDLEDAIFEVLEAFEIETATGEQLDFLGALFGESRMEESDADYRLRIKAKATLQGSGTIEDIISACISLLGGTYAIIRPAYPGKYYIDTDANINYARLNTISPAGVQGFIESFLVDANGNNIIDAQGNFLTCVTE